jgi:cupin fold WbuC family metalloprotein
MPNKVELISENLFSEVIDKAKKSPRLRANHNFHEYEEVYQRFLNVLTKNTYVQPHKHKSPPKPETFIVLKGELGFFLFNDDGSIKEKYLLSEKGPIYGIDIPPNMWHSIVCISEICICFEGKSGPYDPNEDKIFANFAPTESDENRFEYIKKLEGLFK